MDYFVIRSKKKLDELYELLKHRSLPLKIYLQEVFPLRSVEANDYMWGVVYQAVALETGMTADEVHESFKRMFNFKPEFRYNPKTMKMQYYIGTSSTTRLDMYEFWDYIMKVRAWAEIELHICIPLPNEAFTNELKFRHQTKKI